MQVKHFHLLVNSFGTIKFTCSLKVNPTFSKSIIANQQDKIVNYSKFLSIVPLFISGADYKAKTGFSKEIVQLLAKQCLP